MKLTKLLERLSLFWVLQVAGWSIYSLLYYLLFWAHKELDIQNILGYTLTYIIGFTVSLGMREFYRRLNYRKRSMSFLAITVVLSSVVFAIIWLFLDRLLSYPIYGYEMWSEFLSKVTLRTTINSIYWHSFILFTWSALYFVINFWQEWNTQIERTEKAELLAHSAQLQMLRYQLNPHFLFNSLNSIRALIEEDKHSARVMVTELSELLRYSLISKDNSDVPLSDEIGAIRHYFAIEKTRFENKLQVSFDIDPLAEDYPVPSFLIHPLVENAVKYGMQTSSMPLKISVSAKVINESLQITVSNSGTWVNQGEKTPEMNARGTRTGLNNVKQRLENAFPGHYTFQTREENGCVKVSLNISRNIEVNNAKKL